MPRILSVWSPTWAITTWRRKNASDSPAEAPVALIATERGVRRLYSIDPAAAALGLYVGQKATDAMALVPELGAAEADPDGDLASLSALVHWCVRYSPAVAADPPDGLLLDITGVAHLWGGESEMLDDLLLRLARQGIAARGAVAGSAGAAWALARCGDDRTVVPSGAEAQILASLPITGLRLEPETAAQLARLGLVRIGQLASLPRAQLATQAVLIRPWQSITRSYFSSASARRKRAISRQLARENRPLRQRRSENGIARRTPSTMSTRSVNPSSTSQSICASGCRRRISAMAGMLWTTSPSDDTRTINIFCTLDTVSAAPKRRRMNNLR